MVYYRNEQLGKADARSTRPDARPLLQALYPKRFADTRKPMKNVRILILVLAFLGLGMPAGIASGAGRAVLFVRGKRVRTVPIEAAAETLLAEARKLCPGSRL